MRPPHDDRHREPADERERDRAVNRLWSSGSSQRSRTAGDAARSASVPIPLDTTSGAPRNTIRVLDHVDPRQVVGEGVHRRHEREDDRYGPDDERRRPAARPRVARVRTVDAAHGGDVEDHRDDEPDDRQRVEDPRRGDGERAGRRGGRPTAPWARATRDGETARSAGRRGGDGAARGAGSRPRRPPRTGGQARRRRAT